MAGPGGAKVTVRMQGPYDADVPLQVVCYFKHKPEGDKAFGAPVELDRRLGGVIASLRNGGEFVGEAFGGPPDHAEGGGRSNQSRSS